MKKIIAALFAAAATATGAFAWTNNIGLGFSVPINTFNPYEVTADKKTQFAYDAQFMYLGYADKGFTLRASAELGATTIDNLYGDNDTAVGFNLKEHIGIGYSFIRSDKISLSLTGGIGFQEGFFNKDSDTTYTEVLVILGGDLTSVFRLGAHFGLFVNLNLGFAPGAVVYEYKTKSGSKTTTVSDSYGLKGGVSFTPSAGIAFTF